MMVKLTETAARQVKDMIKRQKLTGYGVRAAIVGGGLNGFEYTLSFCEEPSPSDHVFESYGIRMYVDPSSYVYLCEVTIDYVRDDGEAGFVFMNPRPN